VCRNIKKQKHLYAYSKFVLSCLFDSCLFRVHLLWIQLLLMPISTTDINHTSYRRGEPDSSVDVVTGYGLDGPGIESRWGRDFPHLSGPTLGRTQPPVQWVPGLSRSKERTGRGADPSPPSSAVVKKEYSYTSTPPMGLRSVQSLSACKRVHLLYFIQTYLICLLYLAGLGTLSRSF